MDGHGALPGGKGTRSKSCPQEGLLTTKQQLPASPQGSAAPGTLYVQFTELQMYFKSSNSSRARCKPASASLETDALVSVSARRGQGAKPSSPRCRAGSRDGQDGDTGTGDGHPIPRSSPDRSARSQRQQLLRGTVRLSFQEPSAAAQPGAWGFENWWENLPWGKSQGFCKSQAI